LIDWLVGWLTDYAKKSITFADFFMLLSHYGLSSILKQDMAPSCLQRRSREHFPADTFFLKFLLQSDNELLVSEMQKNLGVTDFVSDIKRVENYPDFDKLAHVIQHGLQGFIAKNIKSESTEANVVSQEAFETAAQINEELKITEFDGAFCKKFKFLIDRFSSFCR